VNGIKTKREKNCFCIFSQKLKDGIERVSKEQKPDTSWSSRLQFFFFKYFILFCAADKSAKTHNTLSNIIRSKKGQAIIRVTSLAEFSPVG
jgi:hypothetical protein